MSKHTPGPWEIVPRSDTVNVKAGNRGICRVQRSAGPYMENARLIAAAPKLLEALIELVAVVRGECPSLLDEDSGGDAQLDMQIDDAIAKATGELL